MRFAPSDNPRSVGEDIIEVFSRSVWRCPAMNTLIVVCKCGRLPFNHSRLHHGAADNVRADPQVHWSWYVIDK